MENKENKIDMENLVQNIKSEDDTIRQSVIIGRIIQDTADRSQQAYQKEANRLHGIIKMMAWLLALSIAVNVILVGGFLWYESQMETTTTTTTTVEQDTGTGNGNAVYLSGESAQYHEGQKDGVNDGEAENNNSDNNNQETQNQQ